MQIKDILIPGLKTISPDATMVEAEKIFKEARIRHLPVSNGNEIIGIISDRDLQRARSVVSLVDKGQTYIQGHKKVSDYMSSPVLKMKGSDSVEELTREMIRLKVSSMIIENENGFPVGIITTEDLLLLLLEKLNSSHPAKVLKKLFKGFSS